MCCVFPQESVVLSFDVFSLFKKRIEGCTFSDLSAKSLRPDIEVTLLQEVNES